MNENEAENNDIICETNLNIDSIPEEVKEKETEGVTPPASPAKPKRRRFGFYSILILVVIFLFASIGIGSVFFWRYIDAFEDSRIEHVISALQSNIDFEYWERNAELAIAARLTEFEIEGAVPIQPHLAKIRDVRYDFRQKTDETTPEAPVYIIRAGALDIGVVRFIATADIGYGFNMWEVGSMEFLDSFVDSFCRSIRITASVNAEVTVNGVPVSSSYLDEYEIEYGATYLIDRIFGDVDISVTEFDGRESILSSVENDWYIYPITIPFSRDFNIVIPAGSTIFVDGEPVPPDKITDDAIVPAVFVGAVDSSEIPMFMHRYEFHLTGLYIEPVLTLADSHGRNLVLSENGDAASYGTEQYYVEDFSSEYRELYSGVVENYIRAYTNFAANVGGDVSANLSRLNDYVLRGSELDRRLQASRSAIEWVRGVAVIYNSLTIENFRPYGDSYFSCEASYNITNSTPRGNRELLGSFELLFKELNGRWLAVNMMAIGTVD